MTTAPALVDEEWELLRQFLPASLEAHAREHGAMRRRRGAISSAEQLLRVLLMHIGGGLSLQQTVVRAEQRGLAKLNAMALHKRLCTVGEWFRALTSHLLAAMKPLLEQNGVRFANGRRVRILDATIVSEPGSTGSDWRVHYSVRLPELCCDFFEITDASGAETVRRLDLSAGDLVLLDRAYNDRQAIGELMQTRADVIVRYNSGAFPLIDKNGKAIPLLPKLRKLRIGQSAEWAVWFQTRSGQRLALRACALRKSPQATKLAERKILRKARGKADRVKKGTLEFAKYLVVLTSVPQTELSTDVILEFYRARWQVELAFKRLKTLLELGQLPKKKEQSSLAWMQGKILCALMIERILCEARCFSPWGYPLGSAQPLG